MVEEKTARQRANEYLAGMAARGFVPVPETVARLKAEIAKEEGRRR